MKNLLALTVVIALITLPAMAAPETIELSYSETSSNTEAIGSNYHSISSQAFLMNFSKVTSPSQFVYITSMATKPVPKEGTFQIDYAGNVIATGTYQLANGTFFETYNTQIQLTFNSFDSHSYTTCVAPTINFTPTISVSSFTDQYVNTSSRYAGCGPVGIQWGSLFGGNYYSEKGFYSLVNSVDTDATITMEALSDISENTFIGTEIVKTGDQNIVRLYAYPTDIEIYEGPTDSEPAAFFITGSDIWASMYIPATGAFVNSTDRKFPFLTLAATPTPTPTTTTPPTGYVNTYFQCVDGNDNSRISGCNLMLKDNFDGSWSNSTADDDGTYFITTHENATVSGYATATGYLATERTGLPTFSEGLYELIMWPSDSYCATPGSCGTAYDPGSGNINLLVMVNDHDTGDSISGSEVKLVESAGATTYGSTNSAGVATFIVSNQTQFRVVASKSGYTGTSKIHTTSAFGPDTVRLELSKSYVTASPTVTVTDASGNVVETLDMRPSSEKDAAMMEKLRDAGPQIIDLCIAGIMITILMGILGSMGFKL